MSSSSSSTKEISSAGRLASLLPWLLGFTLVLAPLFRAGQPPVPLLVLQLSAVLMLLLALWTPASVKLTRREAIVLTLLLLVPLLFLIPLPGEAWLWFPGRGQYVDALRATGQDQLDWALATSLYPLKTELAWLTLLIPVAVFVATRTLGHRHLYRLILVLIVIAVAQAVLGLMQFGRGAESALYFGMTHTHFGSGVGTYTNRNHLAGLIEMALPITLALFLYSLGRREAQDSRGWRGRILFLSTFRGHAAFVYGALAVLLIVSVIFTHSRTGVALTMLAVLLVTLTFGRRIGGDNVYGTAGTVLAFAVGIGIAIGLAPVLHRFSASDPLQDARWTIFSATLDGIRNFLPIGSGPGTFPDIFHAFQPLELGNKFVNHAHNDYLEWLFDGGVFAALFIVLLLGLYFVQWRAVWTKDAWSRFRFLQVGAGIGIFLLLLHELVDYNLFIPANMVFFAFLAGIFFSDPSQQAVTSARRRRQRRTPDLEQAAAPGSSTVRPMAPATDQIKNPFLD